MCSGLEDAEKAGLTNCLMSVQTVKYALTGLGAALTDDCNIVPTIRPCGPRGSESHTAPSTALVRQKAINAQF